MPPSSETPACPPAKTARTRAARLHQAQVAFRVHRRDYARPAAQAGKRFGSQGIHPVLPAEVRNR